MNALETIYLNTVVERELYSNFENLRNYLNYCYDGILTSSRTILDIGGGSGVVSLYGIVKGANAVMVLEPEAKGSESIQGAESDFQALSQVLPKGEKSFLKKTLQEFETKQRFDLVILHNSINHLDEPASERLLTDPESYRTYVELFRKIHGIMAPGAQLAVFDCSSRNFFAAFGMKNPFVPTIEWHKHQPPGVWAGILAQAEFHDPVVDWTVPNRLGPRWKRVLNKRWIAFFLFSHFKLVMRR